MTACPFCGSPRLETIVDCTHDAPKRGHPRAVCWVPIFPSHDPSQCEPCGLPAVLVDALFPVYWQGNRCELHRDWPNPLEQFDPAI